MRIKVGFSTHSSNIVSIVIRWLTKSPVSHAWLLLEDTPFGDVVAEASWPEFRLISYAKFKEENTVVCVKEPPIPDQEALLALLTKLLAEPYDVFGLLGGFWVQLGVWIKRHIHNPWHSASKQFCSEAAVHLLQAGKCPLVDATLKPCDVTPDMLKEMLP